MENPRRKEDREHCVNRSTYIPWLKEWRKRAGMSQRELAERAGVSRGTVRRLENGTRGAYVGTLRSLAAALDVAPSEFVRGPRQG